MPEHPKFKAMIEFTARATDVVNFPTRKRSNVQEPYYNTEEHNNICLGLVFAYSIASAQRPTVIGEVNMECDVWQASNTVGYFAVTGHCIEEVVPGQCQIKSSFFASITS